MLSPRSRAISALASMVVGDRNVRIAAIGWRRRSYSAAELDIERWNCRYLQVQVGLVYPTTELGLSSAR